METSTNAYMNDVKISSLQQERSQHVGFERLSQIKCVPTTFIILIACRPTTPPPVQLSRCLDLSSKTLPRVDTVYRASHGIFWHLLLDN